MAVITGVGSGIGRALALALAREGAELALSDIDADALEATRASASGSPRVSARVVDVADRSAVEGWADNIARAARISGLTLGDFSRDQSADRFDEVARTPPEVAAETILADVRRNARRVLIGIDAHAIDVLQRLLPTTYQRIVVNRAKAEQARLL